MLVDRFLQRLNAEAGLASDDRITPRMLEDWVYEDLLPGPRQIARDWQWEEQSLSEALDIIEYRTRGFRRATAIRFQKWLEKGLPSKTADREAIKKEISRAQRILIRYVTSTHGMKADFKLTEYRQKGLLRTLGPLDPALQDAGLGAGSAALLLFYELGRFGKQITPFDENSEPIAAWLSALRWQDGPHVFAGTLEPDTNQEFSVLQAIDKLTPGQLERCRVWTQYFCASLFMGLAFVDLTDIPDSEKRLIIDAYAKVAEGLVMWPWSIFVFATAVNIVYHSEIRSAVAGS